MGPSFDRRPPSAEAAVCGDGIVEGGEACDDDNTDNGDGCSSGCAVETGFACTGGVEGGAPSACLIATQYAIVSGPGGNGTSLVSTAQPDHLEGDEQQVFMVRIRGGAADICSTTYAPIIQCFTSATNAIFRIGCIDDSAGTRGEELRFVAFSGAAAINCDSAALNLNERGWDTMIIDANYEDDNVRVFLAAIGPSQVTAQDLTCGATLPLTTDASSVTCVMAVSPSAGFTSDGLVDEFVVWSRNEASPISDTDIRNFLGEDVNREGEAKLPSQAAWASDSTIGPWYRFGENASDGATGITINTVTNSTAYQFTVYAASADNSGTNVVVNYTSDGSAVNTEIRDGLIADFAAEQIANPTHAIVSMTAAANGADGITITGGRLSIAETDSRLSVPAVVQDVSGLAIHLSGTVRGFANTHLPLRSSIDTWLFGQAFAARSITVGTEDTINVSATVISNEFVMVPDCHRYDYTSLRCTYTHGSDIEHVESRLQYGWSKNSGVDWFHGLGVGVNDNGWTTLVENTVEPTQAPVAANFAGNTHAWLYPFRTDHTLGIIGYRQTYTAAPTSRGAAGQASDLDSDTIAVALDDDGGANEVTFMPVTSGGTAHNRWYGQPIQLLNGDLIGVARAVDTAGACSTGPAQIATWRADASAGDVTQDEQWATEEQVVIDGCNDTPVFRPNYQAIMRIVSQDSDINGDVLLFATAAENLPVPGGTAYQMTILRTSDWAIDPTDTTPAWVNASDGSATTPTSGLLSVPNTENSWVVRPKQMRDGKIVLNVRATDGEQSLITYSADYGATFATQIPVGPEAPACGTGAGGSFGAAVLEHQPGRIGVMGTSATCEQRRNRMIWREFPASLMAAGPETWTLPAASWCRANNGVTNEGIEWGVFPQMGGKSDGSVAFRLHTDDGAANKTAIAQGTDWSVRILSTEAVEFNMGAFSCETAASAITTNADWYYRFAKNGTSLAVFLGTNAGTMAAVACDQDVAGTVPANWPDSTEPIRLMINASDAEPCVSCFMGEIALWDGRAIAGVTQAAALVGADHASLDIDLDWDNDGTVNGSDTDDDGDGQLDTADADDDHDGISDLTDLAGTPDEPIGYLRCLYENARATDPAFGLISEDFGYWPNWGMPLNLDVGDLGATP